MPASEIALRLEDFFERQIAWLEEMRDRFPGLDGPWPDELDELLGVVERQSNEARAFESEFRALKQEWDATSGVEPEMRETLANLARRADRLAQEVRALTDRAAESSGEQARAIQEELGSLGKGRTDMLRYKVDNSEPGYVDRKA